MSIDHASLSSNIHLNKLGNYFDFYANVLSIIFDVFNFYSILPFARLG